MSSNGVTAWASTGRGRSTATAACECGGTFDADALGRCPQCGTMLSKEDIDYDQEFLCWD